MAQEHPFALALDEASVERLLGTTAQDPERVRQVEGLRLVRTLIEAGMVDCENPDLVDVLEPLSLDEVERLLWPFDWTPVSVRLQWPIGHPTSRLLLRDGALDLSPWALCSLMTGHWAEHAENHLCIPLCMSMLICDGLQEVATGRDLLRLTSELDVLELPTHLYSQLLVLGFSDGCGLMEYELQVLDPTGLEVSFHIGDASCSRPNVPCFNVLTLDGLEVVRPGIHTFVLRVLDYELSRQYVDVRLSTDDNNGRGGFLFGQQWTWDIEAFLGERG